MNNLKSRVKKLEQTHSVEPKRHLIIYTVAGNKEYTPKELEDFKPTLDWKQKQFHAIFWDGERFIDKGGNDSEQGRDMEICLSDRGTMELLNEIVQGIDPHEVTP
jgi:hypothetical protein